jgi:hypothetical protein
MTDHEHNRPTKVEAAKKCLTMCSLPIQKDPVQLRGAIGQSRWARLQNVGRFDFKNLSVSDRWDVLPA